MTAVLKVTDKQPGQPACDAFELHLASERLTARELIRRRVAEEVKRINSASARSGHDGTRSFLAGFQADPVEEQLNKPAIRKKRIPLSADKEFEAALAGFEAKAFVMLLDNRQVENLDDEVTVTEDSELVFLRLVPLVGG